MNLMRFVLFSASIINEVIRNVFSLRIEYFLVVFACTIDALFFAHPEAWYAIPKLFSFYVMTNTNETDYFYCVFVLGTTFRAHKLILAACSKHFQELFAAAPPSHAGPCFVILEATSAANMAALLEFMYKGEVHVSQEALSGFLKSAESLQVI